jgi:two-component system, NarL family, invasion response regulator UvrY
VLNILVADDHAVVRQGLKEVLLEEGDILEVGEAASGPAALELCRTRAWDALVLDITMPGRSGVEVLRQLRQDCPTLPIIMISFYLDLDYIQQVLDAGAAGYVAKEDMPEDVVPAVRAVLAGQRYLSQAVRLAQNAQGD